MEAMKESGIGLPDPDVRIPSPRHADKWRQALAGGVGRRGNAGGDGPA